METRDRFRFISPLDHRYWVANRDLFEELAGYLGEEAGVRYGVRVELALLTELLRRLPGRTLDADLERCIQAAAEGVTAAAVAAEERITDHNVRALVNVLQRALPVEVRQPGACRGHFHDITTPPPRYATGTPWAAW